MSKYSRKVRGWGGLGNYTEHRNKKGDVTARTRYHEGKAITTYAPKKPAYTKPGYKAAAYRPSAFDSMASTLLVAVIVIGAIGVGIGLVFNLVNSALTEVWPVVRIIVGWAAVAAWLATAIHLVHATIRRFEYDGADSFMFWLTTVPLTLLSLMGGAMAAGLAADTAVPWLSLLGSLAGLLMLPVALVPLIVFAFMFSKRWLLVIPGAAIMFFWLVLAVPDNGVLAIGLTGFALYAALMVRFNLERD